MTDEEREGGAWIGQHPDANTEKVDVSSTRAPSVWLSPITSLAHFRTRTRTTGRPAIARATGPATTTSAKPARS